jgi:hydrogenase maturation protease
MPEKNIDNAYLNLLPGLSRLSVLMSHGVTLFAGVGNVLRSDDGVGVDIAGKIKEKCRIKVLIVEVSIENYIGRINSAGADNIIIIDTVHSGMKPGYCRLLPAGELEDYTTHTHNISLKKISSLFNAPVWILGIQPASVTFGDRMSEPLLKAAGEIADYINCL